MKYEVTIGERVAQVEIEALGDEAGGLRRYRVRIDDGEPIVIERGRPEPAVLSMLIGGRSWEAGLNDIPDGYIVDLLGVRHELEIVDPRKKALRLATGSGSGAIVTQMPGRVVDILVEAGQTVSKGDPVIIVEAMKMENQLKAPIDGTIGKILVEAGQLVEARTTLVELS